MIADLGAGPSKYDVEIASEMLGRIEKGVPGSIGSNAAAKELEYLFAVHRRYLVQMMRAAYGMPLLPAVDRPA